ncbi:MAG: hypothetical protein AAGD34_22220 [Pseudomonadota bacterium]
MVGQTQRLERATIVAQFRQDKGAPPPRKGPASELSCEVLALLGHELMRALSVRDEADRAGRTLALDPPQTPTDPEAKTSADRLALPATAARLPKPKPKLAAPKLADPRPAAKAAPRPAAPRPSAEGTKAKAVPERQPVSTHRALVVGGDAEAAHGRPSDAARFDRALLLRDTRRVWMRGTFKAKPHALIIVSVRLARVPGANAPGAARLLAQSQSAVASAVKAIAPVYRFDEMAIASILPEISLRQAEMICQAMRGAVAQKSAPHPSSPLIFSAGAVAIHRDEDPVNAVCLAERCYTLAARSGGSRVVAETDAEVRSTRRTHCAQLMADVPA